MKQRIQMIGVLFTVASAGLAMGCGCSSESSRLAPVREVIIDQPQCAIERPVAVREFTTCVTESGSGFNFWSPFRAVGSVISAPFVAVGHALSPSDRYAEPVGERLGGYTSYPDVAYQQERSIRYSQRLMPVGERFTTTRIIHREPILQPVGERFITVKRYHQTMSPVGERYKSTRIIHKNTLLQPVGKWSTMSTAKHHKKMLKPVGEQLTGKSIHSKTLLKPMDKKRATSEKQQATNKLM